MAVIREDSQGLFAFVEGHVARPKHPTIFKPGDKVTSKHFRGSPLIGMGKLPTRGKYQEYWHTTELTTSTYYK